MYVLASSTLSSNSNSNNNGNNNNNNNNTSKLLSDLHASSNPSSPSLSNNNSTSSASNSSSPSATRDYILHCSYMLSDNKQWLISSFTDDRGELLESIFFPLNHINNNSNNNNNNGNNYPLNWKELLNSLWNFALQIVQKMIPHLLQSCKIVIGKFGIIASEEIKGIIYIYIYRIFDRYRI